MIVAISDDKLTDPVNRHTSQTVEFSFRISVTAEFLDEDSISIEDLDAVIGGIRNYYTVVRTHGDSAGPRETSGLAPPTSDFELLTAFLQVLAPRAGTCRCHRETCGNQEPRLEHFHLIFRNITCETTNGKSLLNSFTTLKHHM
jgi:hypothetical protein